MTGPRTPSFGGRVPQPRAVAACAVLCLLALAQFFCNLGAHDLWGPDEVRYALVAREMREGGNYIVPHLNGDVYLEKPPLQFWFTALAARYLSAGLGLRGDHYEVWARLPSALAALITVLLTWRFAARWWDEWTGLVAGAILATNAHFFWFGRNGALDLTLTLWVTVTILCGVRGLRDSRLWPLWGLAMAASTALGLLTKGPVALLVPAVVLGSYAWGIGRVHRGAVLVLSASAGGLFLVLPWWRAAFEGSGGAYGSGSEVLRHTLGRAVSSYSHRGPVYYYALGILAEYLPWSVFFPGALLFAWRARDTVDWPRLRFAWCWIVPPFLVFSAISGKRGQYILPLFPGFAMLVAAYLRTYAGDLRPLRAVRAILIPAAALILLWLALGLGLMVLPWVPLDAWRYFAPLRMPAFGGGIALVSLAGWAILHHLDRPPSRLIATVTVCMALLSGFVAGVALPAADNVKSARQFATMVRGFAGLSTPVVLFHSFRPDIAFYFGRHVELEWPPERILQYGQESPPMLAIMRESAYDRLRGDLPAHFVLLFRERIGSRTWVLLANRPAAT